MGKHRAERQKMPWWQETLLLLGLALVASIVVKAFLLQMYFVPSASMHPTLVEDDRIVVEKVSHWDGRVDRGDVVVFQDPGGWLDATPQPTGLQRFLAVLGLYPEGGHLVKRVIGVGGDHVVCCDKRGRIKVNGDSLDEQDFLPPGTVPSLKRFDVRVPRDAIWVMGDNRSNSEDSRFHQDQPGGGTVPEKAVVGRVWAIVWPLDRMQVLHRPDPFQTLPPPMPRS